MNLCDFKYDRPSFDTPMAQHRPLQNGYLGQWYTTFCSEYEQGRGTKITELGEIEEGYWQQGKLHGKGRKILKDGSVLFGDFLNHRLEGKGVYLGNHCY